MRPTRASRLLRGTAAATIATFVALMSHLAGGGRLPQLLGILVPWVLSLFVCTLLAGTVLSLVRLTVAVAVSQALFHALFVLGAVPPRPGAPTMHAHGGPLPLPVEAMPDMYADDPAMWVWHAAACVVTIVVLHRGERALVRLRTLAGSIARWARRRLAAPVYRPAHPTAVLPVALAPRRLSSAAPRTFVRRRGPPPSLAF